jgi:hypothetical protein
MVDESGDLRDITSPYIQYLEHFDPTNRERISINFHLIKLRMKEESSAYILTLNNTDRHHCCKSY